MMIPEGTGKKLVARRPDLAAKLSPRERETVELALQGQSPKQIAATLFKSQHTIESHMKAIRIKLGVTCIEHIILAFAALEPSSQEAA